MNDYHFSDCFGHLGRSLSELSHLSLSELKSLSGGGAGYRLREALLPEGDSMFTLPMLKYALSAIAEKFLSEESLRYILAEAAAYGGTAARGEGRCIGIVMAGNIPAAGFLDLLCVLACGFRAKVKLSAKDKELIPAMIGIAAEAEGGLGLADMVEFSTSKTGLGEFFRGADAILFSGSDDAAAKMAAEFAGVRMLVRKSRFSFGVVSGDEDERALGALARDIMLYCGLGCRSVSYLFVPDGYDFRPLADAVSGAGDRLGISGIGPYMNALARLRAIASINGRITDCGHGSGSCATEEGDVIDCGCLLLENSREPFPPASIVRFGYYSDAGTVKLFESCHVGHIQKKYTTFGDAQRPDIDDWPDGEDIIRFLCAE